MTIATSYLIIYKLIAMMIVIGCPLAMVSGSGARPKKNRAAANRSGRKKMVKGVNAQTRRPKKQKRTKKVKPRPLSVYEDRLLTDYFMKRNFKQAA